MALSSFFPIKRISNSGNKVFLTFDDGPTYFTPAVLDLLKRHEIQATFFLIVERAEKNQNLLIRILEEGHSIGDHSLDHKYRRYFATNEQTHAWIKASQKKLSDLCNTTPVAFRSPAGVWTPKLSFALRKLSIPWIHWDTRFFDTQAVFTKKQVDKKISKIQKGSIILLHDSQKKQNQESFLEALAYLIEKVRGKGLDFERLTPSICNATGE